MLMAINFNLGIPHLFPTHLWEINHVFTLNYHYMIYILNLARYCP